MECKRTEEFSGKKKKERKKEKKNPLMDRPQTIVLISKFK